MKKKKKELNQTVSLYYSEQMVEYWFESEIKPMLN
jgi:hypothetical protein